MRRLMIIVALILIVTATFYWNSNKISETPVSQTLINEFNQIGNIVQNNPGMKSNVWYLLYESPGQPAISSELKFTQSSICTVEGENGTCDPSTFNQGERVRIIGKKIDKNTVSVIGLEME